MNATVLIMYNNIAILRVVTYHLFTVRIKYLRALGVKKKLSLFFL